MSATTVFGIPITKRLVILCGLGAFAAALPVLITIVIAAMAIRAVDTGTTRMVVTSGHNPGVRSVSTNDPSTGMRAEWREVQLMEGIWVKDGPSVQRSGDGKKLEEGIYLNGKREGQWTFWNADETIDEARSGIYENDARVQEGARLSPY